MKTGSLKSVNNFLKSIDPSDCFKEERQFGIPDSYFKIIYKTDFNAHQLLAHPRF